MAMHASCPWNAGLQPLTAESLLEHACCCCYATRFFLKRAPFAVWELKVEAVRPAYEVMPAVLPPKCFHKMWLAASGDGPSVAGIVVHASGLPMQGTSQCTIAV